MKEKVIDFLQRAIDAKHIPGAIIHVSHQGKVLFQEALGNKRVYPTTSPMTLDTIFDLASLTKVVATLPAILKLIEEGEIRLDDPVAFFLPKFAQHGKDTVNIRHLLTHTSGLPAYKQYYKEDLTTEQILEQIYLERLVYPTGSNVVYSDLGLIILYKVIETVTNMNFETFVQNELFRPLEMFETSFNPMFTRERYAATEYSEKLQAYKSGVVHDENAEAMGGISGHAGLFSTIQDLQKYAMMIENNGIFKGKRILSEAVLDLSRKNYTSFAEEYRGLGWGLKGRSFSSCGDLFSIGSYGHTGFTGTSLWFDPAAELHVILLTNWVHFGRNQPIIRLRPRLHNLIRAYF